MLNKYKVIVVLYKNLIKVIHALCFMNIVNEIGSIYIFFFSSKLNNRTQSNFKMKKNELQKRKVLCLQT